MTETEFDVYAAEYAAGCDDRLKVLLGPTPETFLRVKVDLLLAHLRRRGWSMSDPARRYLDFGCGTGDFINLLLARSAEWRIEGCDISSRMLQIGRQRHPALDRSVRLWNCLETPLPEARYDLITVTCVLHHVDREVLDETLTRLTAALAPGGLLCVFEHNPWNPVTRFMVGRAAIDRNAVLISPAELRNRLVGRRAFPSVRLKHFLFFPPRSTLLTRMEAVLGRLPIGGQYFLSAEKVS